MPTTQVVQRQIADGAINNAKVAAGAAIATNKLAEGADFINRTGSVPFTGIQSMGNFRLTNVGTPNANSTDAATTAYVDAAISSLNSLFDSKGSVKAATIVAGTLATSFANGQTIDAIVLTTGDRILIKNQAAPAENGIYTVNATGAPTRATNMDAWAEVPGAFVVVEEGTANADTIWLCSSNQGGTLNTTAITWQQIPTTAGLQATNFVDKEVPSGTINGVNVTFTLANTPVAGSEHLYLNGILQESGAGNDYTISGATITMLTAPLTGEKLRASYRK
jgi:hypothetical protein